MSPIIEHPEILLYSRLRKSPYFYASRRHGVAMYSVYNHMYHPRHYGDPVAEYWHLLEGVTLWDVGVERQVEISGPDAFDFTNMLVARDLNKCEVGQCKYVFVTAADCGTHRGIPKSPRHPGLRGRVSGHQARHPRQRGGRGLHPGPAGFAQL